MLPTLYIARHGETAWSLSGQHTGLTDLPLTDHGQNNAATSVTSPRTSFAKVFTSPLQRARAMCELAGFGAQAESIATWANGITAMMRTSHSGDPCQRPDGSYFAMAARAASRSAVG
jgi:bisphosphoglycerate-dependent phosphoglycerate mutase